MILSASRRTDIPHYYSKWFMNRIRAGFAYVRNPMNHASLRRVPLSPDIVDCIVFWTKDPQPLLPYLDELDARGYRYYFQFTLTPYDRDTERALRDKSAITDTFLSLSERLGKERVVWRYDPILFTGTYNLDYHCKAFSSLCGKLAGHADTVTVSLVDSYKKLGKQPSYRAPNEAETAALASFMVQTATQKNMRVVACCEEKLLHSYGIEPAHCIDKTRIERICGVPLTIAPDKNQRPGCGCFESVDIGAYDTCAGDCVYCYANRSHETALRHLTSHNPDGELLYGTWYEKDHIAEPRFRSCRQGQQSLFTE